MRKKHNELAMGLTVIIVLAVVVVGILYLQQPGILASGQRIELMIDHVESLARGDEVRFRGVRVGTVQNINFVKSGLDVWLQIDPGVQIPADSKFVVQSAGILGGASIVIDPGSSDQILANNAVVHGERESGLLSVLQSDSSIQDKVKDILTQLQEFPEAAIGTKVQNVLDSLDGTARNLDSVISANKATVNSILDNLDNIVQNNQVDVDSTLKKLNADIEGFKNSLATFDQTLNETRSAIGQIDVMAQSLNSGEGTAGKLLTDNTLYHKLNDTLDAVQALAKDIKENPKKYVQVRVF